MATNLYKQDGVDVASGDAFSAHAGKVCHDSWDNCPYVKVRDLSRGYFRGVRGFSFHHLPRGYCLDIGSDGNGTKVVLTAAAGLYRYAACDLLAMCGMDQIRFGGYGAVFTNVLDVKKLDEPGTPRHQAFVELIEGLGDVARKLRVVLFRGETAELPVCVTSENPDADVQFNWSGSMLGIYDRRRMITGDSIAPGMLIVALREKGFRANGISSVRKALAMRFGHKWWANPDAADSIRAAAEPSVLYDRFLQQLNGWYSEGFRQMVKVHGIVHLSGGAFKGKLGHDILFPRGLSAELDHLCPPPQIMRNCAEWRGMDDESVHDTWNGGQGALLIVSADDLSFVLDEAEDWGVSAQVCGKVVKRDEPIVRIQSQFTPGKEITYRA